MIVLFALQRSDLERVASGGAKDTARAAAEGRQGIENPTTMTEPELWAALAVKPIDNEAIRARSDMWDAGRRSLRLGMLVTLLIFLTVPSIYLFESFVPLLIGGPLIVIAAIYGSIRAVGPGGEMDRGYENVGLAMAPLGLAMTERPKAGRKASSSPAREARRQTGSATSGWPSGWRTRAEAGDANHVFEAPRAAELKRQLSADGGDRPESQHGGN
jgi:hypothetical protein